MYVTIQQYGMNCGAGEDQRDGSIPKEKVAEMTSFLKERRSASSGLRKDPFEVKALVQEIVSVTEDPKSRQFYEKVARSCPADLIFRILSEVKDE